MHIENGSLEVRKERITAIRRILLSELASLKYFTMSKNIH
jgi:hypothetical protein